ncbi:TrbC/VirB2 family protein [Veillonella sp.]|uniref:TrbC/VirB2 family protein n=1 Tax=Veillonella sp. TaxID=1926307 RepID=UPI0025FA0317|nr:TrbC/VirB2 family protein [Veillonella sp.]
MKATRLRSIYNRLQTSYLQKVAALTILFGSSTIFRPIFASTLNSVVGDYEAVEVKLPIMGFLVGLIQFMTGPFAIAIGIIALAAAAFALLKGNGGPVAEKIIFVSIGISLVFFAPTIVSYISQSTDKASGLMIF